MDTRLVVNGHRGLGDHLLCNAIYRALVSRGDRITILVWKHNKPSVDAMLCDLGDSVETLIVERSIDPSGCLNLGFYGEGFDPTRFDESFYRQAKVPFLDKWRKFHIPQEAQTASTHALSTAFIHDDKERGYIIPLSGHRPEKRRTIFEEMASLRVAEEIHCINSCFAILADLMAAPGAKYLHRYSRQDGGKLPILGEHWTVLDKPPEPVDPNQPRFIFKDGEWRVQQPHDAGENNPEWNDCH